MWTHYDVDRSGYIESNELEVLMINTDLSNVIFVPVVPFISGLSYKQRERVSSTFLSTREYDRRLSSTPLKFLASSLD